MRRRKELADRTELNRLLKPTDNGAWLTAIPQRHNGMKLSREEFQDNLLIQYSIVPFNLSNDCDGCVKKFWVPHSLSCPKVGLVLSRKHNTAKEWGALSSQSLNSKYISYEPKINSRIVQGERNGDVARISTGGQEDQGTQYREGVMGQAMVPDESRADVSIHGFYKWDTSALFDM